jgi:nitric oxide dioxygenase
MQSGISQAYIDTSMPVLRAYGLAITTAFYQRLFESHPELKQQFKSGNQATGSQQQSLNPFFYADTDKIENGAVLWGVIERIVLQHGSVSMQDALYPIVGGHLIGAIKVVMAEKAVPELLDTWVKAYGLFSVALIATEQSLFNNNLAPSNQSSMG